MELMLGRPLTPKSKECSFFSTRDKGAATTPTIATALCEYRSEPPSDLVKVDHNEGCHQTKVSNRARSSSWMMDGLFHSAKDEEGSTHHATTACLILDREMSPFVSMVYLRTVTKAGPC